MGLVAEPLETDAAVRADRRSSVCSPSPEEGVRLIRDFVRVKRADHRAEIIAFVAQILVAQEGDQRRLV